MKPKGLQIDWPLAVGLAALMTTRPLMSTFGLFDGIKPAGPLTVTLLLTISWVVLAIYRRPPSSVQTLAAAGGLYGVFAIALPVIIKLTAPHLEPQFIPVPGMVAIIGMNMIWGAFLGWIASLLGKPHH
jgi:hypothetical protein